MLVLHLTTLNENNEKGPCEDSCIVVHRPPEQHG